MKRIAIIASTATDNKSIRGLGLINSIVKSNEANPKFKLDLFIDEKSCSGDYLYTSIIDIESEKKGGHENSNIINIFRKRRESIDEEYYCVWVIESSTLANHIVKYRANSSDFPIYLYTTNKDSNDENYKFLIESGVQFVTNSESCEKNILNYGHSVVHRLNYQDINAEYISNISKLDISDALISVIVPVYNVENYLERCVNTIINQTYHNLEIILVDDGSKDDGGKICDKLGDQDSRIRVIHQKNAGLSAARNSGLDIFSGQYVFFVDSDDAIDTTTIEKMYYQLNRYNADVVACGYGYVDDDYFKGLTTQEPITRNIYGCWNGVAAVYELIKGKTIGPVAWNKLYKRELWSTLRFPVGKIHEDEATTYKAIYNSKIVAYIPDNFYKYYRRAGSIMSAGLESRKKDFLDAIKDRLIYFKLADEKYLTAVSEVAYLDYLKYLYRVVDNKDEKRRFASEYNLTIEEYSIPSVLGWKKAVGLILWKYLRY